MKVVKKASWLVMCCGLIAALLANRASYAVDREDLRSGVVQIKTFSDSELLNEGAGIVIGTEANRVLILTAYHVIGRSNKIANQIEIRFRGRAKHFPGERYFPGEPYFQYSRELDIAVVIVEIPSEEEAWHEQLPALPERPPSEPEEGDNVISIGHPRESPWQSASHEIVGLSYEQDSRKLTISRGTIGAGCSGGPLFDEQGRLIGMVTDITTAAQTVAVATKIDPILFLLDKEWSILPPRNDSEKPDLWSSPAQDFYDAEPPYEVGQTVTWAFSIENRGDAEAQPSQVTFALGSPETNFWRELEPQSLPGIPPGESVTVQMTYQFKKDEWGIRIFYVKVDQQNVLVETNELDNIRATDPFWVAPPFSPIPSQNRVSLGVLAFDNQLNPEHKDRWQRLAGDIADETVSKLGAIKQLVLVERQHLEFLQNAKHSGIDRQQLSDAAYVRELGRLVGAQLLCYGSLKENPFVNNPEDWWPYVRVAVVDTGVIIYSQNLLSVKYAGDLRTVIDDLTKEILKGVSKSFPDIPLPVEGPE